MRKDQAAVRSRHVVTSDDAGTMQAEIDRRQRELEETRKQLDFAKKATAFFAHQQK